MDHRAEVRGRLVAVLARIEDRLTIDQIAFLRDLVRADEWGIALEQIADVLSEDGVGLRDEERDRLLALNGLLGMGDRVPQALSSCPRIG